MGYRVLRGDEHEWEERPMAVSGASRHIVDVTTAAGLGQSRARIWRYPPATRGRRHAEVAQEEVFVVLEGTLTMLLGDPPERAELSGSSVAVVQPGTPLQVRNDGDVEAVVLIVGAPPETGRGEILPDVD